MSIFSISNMFGGFGMFGSSNKKNRVIFTSIDNFIIVSSDNYIFTGVK